MRKTLIEYAFKGQKNAYAPYSNFKVGSSILADNQKVYVGCNVENAAYPSGQCAEATAIGTMIADGGKAIKEIVVASPTDEYCFPCGNCRQKISEFSTAETKVTMVTQSNEIKTVTMAELLPFAFSSKDLED